MLLVAPTMAYEISEENKNMLEPQLENMLKNLTLLETAIVAKDQAYQAAVVARTEIEKKLADPQTGMIAKGKLKFSLSSAQSTEKKALKELQAVKAEMASIQAVLAVLDRRPMSEVEMKTATEVLPLIEFAQKDQAKKLNKLQKKYDKALLRIERIPSEKVAAEAMLKQHQQTLDELNKNKTWGNLAARTEEEGFIKYENSKLSSLAKELVKQEKIKADYETLRTQKVGLEVAIAYIKEGKVTVEQPATIDVEPEPTTPDEPEEPDED